MITLSGNWLTEPPAVSVLAAVVRRHRAEQPRRQRLRRYFAGQNDRILRRGEGSLPHPIARYIALLSSGYLTGQPVRYEAEGQEEALRDALDWAKGHVDYVVHTGDLIDWQSEANFDLVRKYFGDGYIGSLGNHEFSPDMWLSEPKESRDEAWKDRTRAKLQEVYPFDVRFASQVANGVNFVTLDDVFGYVTWEQVNRFREEVKKGLPIVLCMHVPFFTETIWRAETRFWIKGGKMEGNGTLAEPVGDYKIQLEDSVTRDFIAYLKQEPLLKCILTGHLHITVEDQFSPTCREYVTAGGFLFHGREVIFI